MDNRGDSWPGTVFAGVVVGWSAVWLATDLIDLALSVALALRYTAFRKVAAQRGRWLNTRRSNKEPPGVC